MPETPSDDWPIWSFTPVAFAPTCRLNEGRVRVNAEIASVLPVTDASKWPSVPIENALTVKVETPLHARFTFDAPRVTTAGEPLRLSV